MIQYGFELYFKHAKKSILIITKMLKKKTNRIMKMRIHRFIGTDTRKTNRTNIRSL